MQRPSFDPWVGKIPWRRKWLPTPVCLPGESHGLRSLVVYSPWGHKESDTTEQLVLSLFFRNYRQWGNNFTKNRTDTVPSFCEGVSQHEEHCFKCQLPRYRACSWVIAFRPSSYTKGKTQPRPGPFRDCVNTFHWVCCLQRDSTQCS